MTDLRTVARILAQVVAGALSRLDQLLRASHATLEQARGQIERLLLTRQAVLRVLTGLEAGTLDPPIVQPRASLMKRGYVAGSESLPMRPIRIEWEQEFETSIAEVLMRLDELGDTVDGEIDQNEMTQLRSMLQD